VATAKKAKNVALVARKQTTKLEQSLSLDIYGRKGLINRNIIVNQMQTSAMMQLLQLIIANTFYRNGSCRCYTKI
jgi:hypothetical protein